MSVYVDRLMKWPRTKAWPYGEACHLFADGLEELHAFAAKIGMRRAWFQGKATLPHYDLTAKRRAAAVAAGAKEVEREWIRERLQAARRTKDFKMTWGPPVNVSVDPNGGARWVWIGHGDAFQLPDSVHTLDVNAIAAFVRAKEASAAAAARSRNSVDGKIP